MNAVFVQKGRSIDYTPSADVGAGDIVVVGNRAAIAKLDIASGEFGALALTGVFDVVKASAVVFAFGSKVWWDKTNLTALTAPTANTVYLGPALAAAAGDTATGAGDGDTVVRVLLEDRGPVAAAVADLAADATLAVSVTKINELLAALRAAGVIAISA